jgi:hypothetical protein
MDVLRAYAYLDLINGIPAEARIAGAEAQDESAEAAEALAWAEARAAAKTAEARTGTASAAEPARAEPGANARPADTRSDPAEDGRDQCGEDYSAEDDDSGDDDDEAGDDDGPGGDTPGLGPGNGPGPGVPPAGRTLLPRPPDLVVPLATLLGLAERPAEIQGFGLLDPALARDLAAAAAAAPRTEVCVTIASPEGYAIGHGCARIDRSHRSPESQAASPGGSSPVAPSPAGLPARLNLTIPVAALAGLSGRTGLVGPWAFIPRGSPGPPDGFGAWSLVLPDGRRFTVRLRPVPVFDCDHRYESRGYRPGDRLRHLVQVRDGTCTFPPCNRHALESDFEHAVPYDKGGRTCACNAGARSRSCHRVKQSKGWKVTQPSPGWHRWQTPAGRVYLQEPWRYPA